jgi:hypothetical protein
MKDFLLHLRDRINDNNVVVKIDKNRHDQHIRIGKLSISKFNVEGCEVLETKQDTRYSTGYKTTFVRFNDIVYPVVFADRSAKNGDNKILQKELTPEKLNIQGTYFSYDILHNDIIKGIKTKTNLKNYPSLYNLLLSLLNLISNDKELTTTEEELYFQNSASINKDFGELLSALYLLKNNSYKSITFSENESASSYDIIGITNQGLKKRINIKSGGGSGQSFKSLSKGQIEDLLNENNFEINSDYHLYSKVIEIFSDQSRIAGRVRFFRAFNILKESDSNIGNAFKEISNIFFSGKDINESNFSINDSFSFPDYVKIIEDLNTKYFDKSVGVPKGTKNKPAIDTFKDKVDKKGLNIAILDALLFTLSTWTSNFTDNSILSDIMNTLIVNKVHLFFINCKNKKLIFEEHKITNMKYKFHYWANYPQPTNNLLGYKIIK